MTLALGEFEDASLRMPSTTQPLLLQSHKASLPESVLHRLIQRTHQVLPYLRGSIVQVSGNVCPGVLVQQHRQCP